MTSGWNKARLVRQGGLLNPLQCELCFTEWGWGDTPCAPKRWKLLSEVIAFVIVNVCWCFHQVMHLLKFISCSLVCLCLHRVREAAMTSLMEVTLLLVQSEAELINANMYGIVIIVIVWAFRAASRPAGMQCLGTPCSLLSWVGQNLELLQAHTDVEDVASGFQRENLMEGGNPTLEVQHIS